ncbi:hypothetical protein MMC07_008172 [Pseudocyphellaria aurata]|nr:hypothetical protein [Pseudocyphellaria aurata]
MPDQPTPDQIAPTGAFRVQVTIPANTPFNKKWDLLKPVIEQLYIDDNQSVSEVSAILKRDYGFAAEVHDFKYHLKKWKLKKNISTSKKGAMLNIRRQRTETGKKTAFIYKGAKVDDKKLRRQVKANVRREVARRPVGTDGGGNLSLLSGSAFQVSNSIFLNWNIPYGTLRSFTAQSPNPPVSSPVALSTPSDIAVTTPANAVYSPNNTSSPFTRDQNLQITIERAYMLSAGQFDALVRSMRQEERDAMSTWLYQFWFHGFKTAKHWGRGPRRWTASFLRFDAVQALSPALHPVLPRGDITASNSQLNSTSTRVRTVHVPSQLCKWSIHYRQDVRYQYIMSQTPSPEPEPEPDLLDEESWRDWPIASENQSCQERLLESVVGNDFSDINTEDLPIAVSHLVKTLEAPNDRLIEEAFGFGVMARNVKVLDELSRELGKFSRELYEEVRKRIEEIHPFHLASSYLDGSKTCCSVFGTLITMERLPLRSKSRNKMGHTVFDNLMIAILKAHTSITPGMIDDGLRNEKRFPGEEVDICGRWDADSDCVRELLRAGDSSIPFAWKHKFCHTSVQVICHCVDTIIQIGYCVHDEPVLDVPSGLFIKRCETCGLRMELQPLHTIVLTAIFVACFGATDEDMFDMLAVLLTVLKEGADPRVTVEISIPALFPNEADNADLTGCIHQHFTPLDLANSLHSRLVERWSSKTRTGWEIFCHVLRLSEQTWKSFKLPFMDDDCILDEDARDKNHRWRTPNYFGKTRELAVLSGAVQAEYLTYRRVAEGDPWLSSNFDMDAIRESLDKDEMPTIGFFENDMVHPVCNCGNFNSFTPGVPLAQDIMRDHFSNLEDWSRTTFIHDLHHDDVRHRDY